jgi:succinyl-diaminopimelate desuccinylase
MDESVELTCALIECRSVTPHDAGCIELIEEKLLPLGFATEHLDFGETRNLFMRHGTESPLLVFLGHTDVVPSGPEADWKHPPFNATIEGDLLYGRGAADMKSGVAAMVTALARFAKSHPDHRGSVGILMTSDEEGAAHDGVVKVVETFEARNQKIDWCVIGEPSSFDQLGDVIRVGRRGSLNGVLRIQGVQGHVAYPEKANNPIHGLAPALAELVSEVWDQGNEFFPPTSFQVSNITSGTGAENVIPGRLEMLFNFRFSTAVTEGELKERVTAILDRHGVTYTLDWRLSGAPFLTTGSTLIEATQSAIESVMGHRARPDTGGGTSDGRFIAPTGAEVVELGPLNASIHKVNENTPIRDIVSLSSIYEQILVNLLS